MKKLLILISLFLVLLSVIYHVASAQDIITMKSGEEIKAKVTTVTKWEVIYLRENTTAPTYSIMKSEIFMIKYSDGHKDIFTTTTAPSPQPQVQQPQTTYEKYHYENKSNTTGCVVVNIGSAIRGDKFNYEGLADIGFNASLSTNFLFVKNGHIGLSTLTSFTTNPYRSNQFRNMVSNADPYNDYSVVGYSQYSSTNLMGGLFTTFASQWFSFDTRLVSGISFSNLASSMLDATDYYGNTAKVGYYGTNAITFVGDAGFGFRVNVMKSMCLTASMDYMYSQPKFVVSVKMFDYDFNGNLIQGEPIKQYIKQTEDQFLFTGGIGFCF